MHNDNLQGILFDADDKILFLDVSTRPKQVLGQTKRVIHRVNRLKKQYNYMLPLTRRKVIADVYPLGQLQSRQAADVAARFHR